MSKSTKILIALLILIGIFSIGVIVVSSFSTTNQTPSENYTQPPF